MNSITVDITSSNEYAADYLCVVQHASDALWTSEISHDVISTPPKSVLRVQKWLMHPDWWDSFVSVIGIRQCPWRRWSKLHHVLSDCAADGLKNASVSVPAPESKHTMEGFYVPNISCKPSNPGLPPLSIVGCFSTSINCCCIALLFGLPSRRSILPAS